MTHSVHCGRRAIVESRRAFLCKSAHGFGTLALAHLLAAERMTAGRAATAAGAINPLAARPPHFAAKARSVILLYMTGGPSQVDTFDPKPRLRQLDGQPLPESFRSGDLKLQFMKATDGKLMGSPFPFRKHGESGLEISSIFPRLAEHADDLAVVRSCYHDSFIHGPAINYLCTGSSQVGHPSLA